MFIRLLFLLILISSCNKQQSYEVFLPFEKPRTVPNVEVLNDTLQSFKVHDVLSSSSLNLVFFGYTFCPDICPFTLADVAQIVGDQSIGIIFISVDNERDSTKADLYAKAFHPKARGFVIKDEETLQAFTRYLGVFYQKNDNLVEHTSSVLLINNQAQFLGVFNDTKQIESIQRDLKKL